jgi:hypothetical protein
MGLKRQLEPTDFENNLDTARVNLQATAASTFPSGHIDVRKYFIFTLVWIIVETTTTVGAMKVTFKVLKKDRSSTLWSFDIITAIDPSSSSTGVLVFGGGATAKLLSTSSGALSADADVFKTAEYIELVPTVVTQADGDATIEFHLLMEG